MHIKEKISSELELAPPEILDQVYEFIQLLKCSINYIHETGKHYLSPFAGSFDNDSAKEISNCVNNEFQNIEGER